MVNATLLKLPLHTSYRMLDGSQGPSGRVRKICPTLGFDLRIIQPVEILFPIYYSNANMCLVKLIGLEICGWSWKVRSGSGTVSVCCHQVATTALSLPWYSALLYNLTSP